MKHRSIKALEFASLVAGIALFAYLIKQTGLDVLSDYIAKLGWGFAFVVALSGLRNLLRAAAWFYSIEPGSRKLSFWQLLNVMLAGEAIKFLTATGPLLAEPAKAAMVRREVPLLEGFSSIVVENLIYDLSVVLIMLAGLPALAWLADVPHKMKVAGYVFGVAIVLIVLVAWMAIRWRWYLLARMLERVSRLANRRRRDGESKTGRLETLITRVRSVEANVYSFYERRRGAFILIFAIDMAAHLINVVEVYAILLMMGQPSSLAVGFVIEAVTKVINMAFFFVPTRAGVYESGHAMVIGALGMSASVGVALAIIRKLRAFVWVGYGLGAIGAMAVRDRRAHQSAAETAASD